ncbi:MAG: shikimate kinase [Alphaproteobacteria bacterium]|nr:shikimate kinase [Alphaproteobacteria bacterium]
MTDIRTLKLPKTLVMVGMMGAGKTAIGRRIAARLGLSFVDADDAIADAAGCSIEDIFERHGEAAFRDGERRVIERLLTAPVHILATGGGAFIDSQTRTRILRDCLSVWLRVETDVLWRRVKRRTDRPLLQTEAPYETLVKLVEKRYPIYAEADITVDSIDGPAEDTVDSVLSAVAAHLREEGKTV